MDSGDLAKGKALLYHTPPSATHTHTGSALISTVRIWVLLGTVTRSSSGSGLREVHTSAAPGLGGTLESLAWPLPFLF